MSEDLQYYTILTDAGVRYEADCLATESAFHLTHIAIGDGGGEEIIPNPAQTSLVNEIKRYEVTREETDYDNGLYYALIQIPAEDGEFTIRELGGYNESGTLVMVSKFPPTVKRVQTSGDIRRMFIRMDLSIINSKTFPTVVNPDLAFPSTEYVTNKIDEIYTNDLNNVKITGNQTIDGEKEFLKDIKGNCTTATKLKTSRTISLKGAVTGSVSFDGTSAVSINTSIGTTNYGLPGITGLFNAFMPDWSSRTKLGTSYTVTEAGWVNWVCNENDATRDLKINGCIVARVRAAGRHDACGTAALVPVKAGDTVTRSGGTAYFMPLLYKEGL